ncbi:hypothetical protein FQN50_002324 [Emmonsiellopsis sp. PD_5]|nr:hypothetical protein FQN50_002324 [Emmonsiellopsis sp. PD_5]
MPLSDLAQQACDYLKDPLPDIQRNGCGTTSTTLHQLYYGGPLGLWEDFEAKCHEVVCTHILLHRSRSSIKSSFGCGFDEVYICGDELSVSGRFTECTLNPVIHALKETVPVQFGDFKASRKLSSGKIPNFVMLGLQSGLKYNKATDAPITEISQAKMVGEIKTPWMHSLNSLSGDDGITRLFGQIIQYMLKLKLKYGFLTTYEQTIFLTQEQRAKDKKWVIYYSNPILHTTSTATNIPKMGNLKDTISVKDCMAAVTWLAHEDFEVFRGDNTEQLVQMFRSLPDFVTPSKDKTDKSLPVNKASPPISIVDFDPQVDVAEYDSSNSNHSSRSDTPRTPIPLADKEREPIYRPSPIQKDQRDHETRPTSLPERPRRQPQTIHLTRVGKDRYWGIVAGQHREFGPKDLRKEGAKIQLRANQIWHEAIISDISDPDEKEASKKSSKAGNISGNRRN